MDFWNSVGVFSTINVPQAVWRYIGTARGVFRIFPGVEFNREYDPRERDWWVYKNHTVKVCEMRVMSCYNFVKYFQNTPKSWICFLILSVLCMYVVCVCVCNHGGIFTLSRVFMTRYKLPARPGAEKYQISTPYLDALGAGYIVTFSEVVTQAQ